MQASLPGCRHPKRCAAAESKIEALNAAGVPVADSTSEIPGLVKEALAKLG
jgi:succinyl-CoA synthetase alpha subunit